MGFNTKSSSNDLEDLDHHDEMDTSVDQVGLPKPWAARWFAVDQAQDFKNSSLAIY